jgi:hypothetical protein
MRSFAYWAGMTIFGLLLVGGLVWEFVHAGRRRRTSIWHKFAVGLMVILLFYLAVLLIDVVGGRP